MQPLEDHFPPPSPMPTHVDGIIVLGGAIDRAESAARGRPALNGHAERMTAFVSLARRYPQARLLFTGGNPDLHLSGPTEADAARMEFAGLGLDVHRVAFERRSRNTRENALLSKSVANPSLGQTWFLVTSAADMPRTVGCFRAVGWPVVAHPVDFHGRRWHSGPIPGLVSGLRNVDWAAHEWIGLVYYWLRGWISSLLPESLTASSKEAERDARLRLTQNPGIIAGAVAVGERRESGRSGNGNG